MQKYANFFAEFLCKIERHPPLLLSIKKEKMNFASALSDAELQIVTASFSKSLWEPEFGWSSIETEASETPHPPQLFSAMMTFLYFFVAGQKCAWVHLAAEMQAGKTGVVSALLRIIFSNARTLRITPDRVFIITGMSDNAWVKQTKERLPLGVRSGVAHSGGLTKTVKALRGLASAAPLSNILIVLDESHIASAYNNRPNLIYSEIAALCPQEQWNERNIRFLTISATDPAKALAISAPTMPIKARVVRLHTSDAYQSVESLSASGRVRFAETFGDIHEARAVTELKRVIAEFAEPRYHLLRARYGKQKTVEDLLRLAFPAAAVISWDSKSRPENTDEGSSSKMEDINELLETEPAVHTFIILKNMFYASKTMDDTHVGILYDRVGGKDDTNLQSLLGRACGYGKSQTTIIYTSEQTVKNYLGFWKEVIVGCPAPTDIPMSMLDRKMPFTRANRNVVVDAGHATPGVFGTGAMAGGLPEDEQREKKNEDDYTAEWSEFKTFDEARAWARGVHAKKMDERGFYLSSTSKGAEVLRYDAVMAMKAGKKTANLPKTDVGKSVNRLYVGYKDLDNKDSAVFIVRRVTRLR